MTIFLDGGGNNNSLIENKFIEIIKNKKDNKKLLHILLAQDFPFRNNNVDKLGFNNIDIIYGLGTLRELDFLNKNYSAIYLDEGNSSQLLYYLRESNFDKKLIKYEKKGGIIYGKSAGAIVLGKSIETSNSAIINECKSYDSLNIVGKYSIQCHFNTWDTPNINKPVIGIPENAGIIIENLEAKVIGNSNVHIFNTSKKNFLKLIKPENTFRIE